VRNGLNTAAIAARVTDLGSECEPPVSAPRVGDAASSLSLPLVCVRTYMELAQLSSSSGRYLRIVTIIQSGTVGGVQPVDFLLFPAQKRHHRRIYFLFLALRTAPPWQLRSLVRISPTTLKAHTPFPRSPPSASPCPALHRERQSLTYQRAAPCSSGLPPATTPHVTSHLRFTRRK
jgi:hypothetical protein